MNQMWIDGFFEEAERQGVPPAAMDALLKVAIMREALKDKHFKQGFQSVTPADIARAKGGTTSEGGGIGSGPSGQQIPIPTSK